MTARRAVLAGLLVAGSLVAGPAMAVQPDERLADPAEEARAREVSAELRCLVCQNQSIDDSNAPLARDLRLLVRERITAGDTNDEVVDFIVDRYGEYVLLRPVFEMHTLVLWLAGPALLVVGAASAFLAWRRRTSQGETTGLTAAEEARLKALLDGDPKG